MRTTRAVSNACRSIQLEKCRLNGVEIGDRKMRVEFQSNDRRRKDRKYQQLSWSEGCYICHKFGHFARECNEKRGIHQSLRLDYGDRRSRDRKRRSRSRSRSKHDRRRRSRSRSHKRCTTMEGGYVREEVSFKGPLQRFTKKERQVQERKGQISVEKAFRFVKMMTKVIVSQINGVIQQPCCCCCRGQASSYLNC